MSSYNFELPNRIVDQFQSLLGTLPNGGSAPLVVDWDRTKTAFPLLDPDLYYASGTFSVESTTNIMVAKDSSRNVTVSGGVTNRFYDPYDWHPGLTAWGFGDVEDADGECLRSQGKAKNFLQQRIWNNPITHNNGVLSWR